jgi:hypothetical protein
MRVRSCNLVTIDADDQPVTTFACKLQQTDVPRVQHVKPAGNEHRFHMLFAALSSLVRWKKPLIGGRRE